MADVPQEPIYDKDDATHDIFQKQLIDAMKTLNRLATAKTMQRIPLERVLKPLSLKERVLVSARKFLPGFLIGALGYLADAVAGGGVAALTGGAGVFLAAGMYGALGGLGLSGYKYIKETNKDRKLDKEVRQPEQFRTEGYNAAQMDYIAHIVTITMNLANAAGLNTAEALRQVYTMLDILHELPYEVSEFLLTLSNVVEDGTASGGFTAAQIKRVLDEASDVKDAAKRLQDMWNER